MANGPSWSPFIFRGDDNDNEDLNHKYKPFDGTMPLLPPWHPPTIEADFRYNAQRIVSREAEEPLKKVVKIECEGHGTMFAEVVQEIGPQSAREGKQAKPRRVWLRPLLLDHLDTFMDLRGGTDLVLDAAKVADVSNETRTRITANLAAIEGDMLSRQEASEWRWQDATSTAVINFVRDLSASEEKED